MRINIDFMDFETFLIVKETGSFHQAAERLGLSQSAVTRRIQKLEAQLDTQLFERSTRAVRPTLAAKRLQARAEAIVADVKETTMAMRDESMAFSHQRNAVVTVALVPTLISQYLPAAIQQMRAEGHGARVRVLDMGANEVGEAVAEGEADFGVCSLPAMEGNAHFEPLFDDPMVAVVSAEHHLAQADHVTWQQLLGEELILPARGTGNRLIIDEAIASQRLSLSWTYEVSRTSSTLAMVAGGVGVAIVPRTAALGHGGIISLELKRPSIARPIGILTRLGQHNSDAAESLKRALQQLTLPGFS